MKIFSTVKPIMCLLGTMAGLSGCIKDGAVECPPAHFIVKAFTLSGAEVPPGEVSDVTLYVFDGSQRFVQRIPTQLNTPVEINTPADGEFNIVAWGNLGGGKENVPSPAVGDPKNTAFVTLQADTRASSPSYPCDDLFFGEIFLSEEHLEGEIVIPIYRKVGSMAITLRKLKEYSGYTDDNFSVVVRETFNTIDFNGIYTGSMASYRLAGAFDANGDFNIPIFYLIPGKELAIDVYHDGVLIYTATANADGQPLDVRADKLTNVLIDFNGSVSVSVNMTEWGSATVWKQF